MKDYRDFMIDICTTFDFKKQTQKVVLKNKIK